MQWLLPEIVLAVIAIVGFYRSCAGLAPLPVEMKSGFYILSCICDVDTWDSSLIRKLRMSIRRDTVGLQASVSSRCPRRLHPYFIIILSLSLCHFSLFAGSLFFPWLLRKENYHNTLHGQVGITVVICYCQTVWSSLTRNVYSCR